jgi:hypothetical protein
MAEVRLLLLCYQIVSKHGPTGNSPYFASIHILDNDSLLNIFFSCRSAIFDGDESDDIRIFGGKAWNRERWWYRLTQICQRWRNIILGSPTYLQLCLVCTRGTPVADMLAHSPPLPLDIDFSTFETDLAITAEDEEGIILALEQRDRVRRVRLSMPVRNMQKLIVVIDEEYPVLEYLIMLPSIQDRSTALMFPTTFQAPHLRHLTLNGFALPIGSRLLTTAVGLVTLILSLGHPPTYIQPNILLQWLSFMPQLNTLMITLLFPVLDRDVERQLMRTPIMTHVTLSNLRWFRFQGVSAYMDAVVRRISAPRLERLDIHFSNDIIFSVPRLLQFMNTTENLRFNSAEFEFSRDAVRAKVYLGEEAEMHALQMTVSCWHLGWQVFSVAQIFNSLSQIFSTVEHLTLKHKVHSRSSGEHNEVDRTEWRKLLKSFSNVKALYIDGDLVKELSRCLRLDDGELPLELLPELQELTYPGSSDTSHAFTSFIDARQDAGQPVTLVLDRSKFLLTSERLVEADALLKDASQKVQEFRSTLSVDNYIMARGLLTR